MSLPNFLVVGAAKSGTTSLYHSLRQHPQIFLPEVKEPHFFTDDRPLGFPTVTKLDEYESLFDGVESPARGEASTGYLYFPESPDLIHARIPDCRIIVMLRNPVDRALSMWGHQRREGLEPLTLEQALDEETAAGLRRIRGVEYGFNYLRLGRVADRLARFRELFGPDRVHVAFYDDWVEDPGAVLRRVFHFLGVDPDFEGRWGARHNASGVPRHGWLHRYLNGSGRLRRLSITPLRWLLPKQVRHAVWQKLRDWNIRRGSRHVLAAQTRRRLLAAYAAEIERVEAMLGRDLAAGIRSEEQASSLEETREE